MKYFLNTIKILMFFSFLFHSYIVMTPALDELGAFRTVLHLLLATLAWTLFNLTNVMYEEDDRGR